jgi:hypothetical protein
MSGRGQSLKTKMLTEAARFILEEIHPASVRAVCYQLFVRGLIPSMATGETQKVSRIMVIAREKGIIPWSHIVDETRGAERIAEWGNLEELGQSVLGFYRKDFWRQQEETVEIWSEKGTVRGTIKPILDELSVTFRVMHGFSSATIVHNVAAESHRLELPLRALYIGDWDPSGLYMSEVDLPQRLAKYGAKVDLTRVALTSTDTRSLTPFEAATKRGDPRHEWFTSNYGDMCWELDSMSPPVLRERVREYVESWIEPEAWERCVLVEAAERESLARFKWGEVFPDKYENSPDGEP